MKKFFNFSYPLLSTLLLASLVSMIIIPNNSLAATSGLVGRWKQIDDETHQPRSIVQIEEKDGQYVGRIEKIFPRPGRPADPKCEKCPDQFKDQPVLGLQFIWDLKKESDSENQFSGGHILDPNNGKIYRCKMKLAEDGQHLTVRGYLGISLLGRSQEWIREL